MTTSEIIAEQQRQIDELLEIGRKCFIKIDELKMLNNWQKLEIDMLKDRQFVKNDN